MKHHLRFVSKFFLVLTICTFPSKVWATKVHGRILFGGYAATERFKDEASGSSKNDVLTASGRFYLKLSEMGDGGWEVVTDLRDKHDFFEKLDREKLELTPVNSFQVRQMSVRRPAWSGFLGGMAGRFPVTEAGAAHVDGGQLDFHFTRDISLGTFGGLNPKPADQSYLEWNNNANIYGAYLLYQPQVSGWVQNFYLTHAYVDQVYLGDIDRQYFYHNMIYQWDVSSRFVSFLYWDFVPRSNVQTASVSWNQGYGKYFSSNASYLAVDVIEYTRRRGVRERLTPSPYKEGRLDLNYSDSGTTFEFFTLHGSRSSDGMNKTDTGVGAALSGVFSKRMDLFGKVGFRKNFTSKDYWAKAGTGYFSDEWEFTFDCEYAVENNDDNSVTHPIIIEVGASNYISRSLFATVSLQNASDERVNITSAFFKIGYRFGEQNLPAIRDGAPPRGRL